MIPKKAIEKAIRGGWNPLEEYDLSTLRITDSNVKGNLVVIHSRTTWSDGVVDTDVTDISFYEVALDPSFWNALEGPLSWRREPHWFYNGKSSMKNNGVLDAGRMSFFGTEAEWYAHRFCDLILAGQPTEKFWDQLLGNSAAQTC